MTEDAQRALGHATNGQIADIIEEISPILQAHPFDHQLIALAAAVLLRLDGELDLDRLHEGSEILIRTAAAFVSDPEAVAAEWEVIPDSKIN